MKNAKKTKTSNSYFTMMWDVKHYFLYKEKKKLPHETELNSLVFLMNGLFIKKKPNLKKKKKNRIVHIHEKPLNPKKHRLIKPQIFKTVSKRTLKKGNRGMKNHLQYVEH